MKYDQLEIYKDIIGTCACRIQVDIPTGPRSKSWRSAGLVIDTWKDPDLGQKWRDNVAEGAHHVLQESYVTSTDPHLDAKLWPHMHPYGTGSMLSEVSSGGLHRFARNRLLLVESCFRRSSLYAFWLLHRMITTELFFKNVTKRKLGQDKSEPSADPITRLFGTAVPSSIPESTAWS